MNDSMTSVADIPDDVDDELAGISPELVLVDPELARLVRERERAYPVSPPVLERPAPSLRLVAPPGAELPIVPRPAARGSIDPSPSARAERADDPPVRGQSSAGAEAAPHPPRPPLPVPLGEPQRRGVDTARVGDAVTPHPAKRLSGASVPARGLPRSSGREWRLTPLLLAIAVASLAVLGIMRLTGGSSDPGSGDGRTAIGAGPTAVKASTPKSTAKHAAAPTSSRSAPESKSPTESAAPSKPVSRTRTSSSELPPRSKAAVKAPKNSPSAATPPPTAARRFAWAPVGGATGYHVELFRGADRVLARDTREPVLELGSSWRYEGKTVQLAPGAYRWYVWPVTKAGRAAQAVVQAKLTVP